MQYIYYQPSGNAGVPSLEYTLRSYFTVNLLFPFSIFLTATTGYSAVFFIDLPKVILTTYVRTFFLFTGIDYHHRDP